MTSPNQKGRKDAMSSERHAVGRTLGTGFKSFLLLLGIAIAVSFVVGSFQSSMTFLLFLPAIASLVIMVAYYIYLSTDIGR